MANRPTLCLIRANLPRYFPEKHGVWGRVEAALEEMCSQRKMRFVPTTGVVTDAREARKALSECAEKNADFVMLVHGGFTMGDVGREIAASDFRLGVWTVPEPIRTGDVQLNNFVSLNMTMSIARQVRDLRANPMQWYHGDPQSAELRTRIGTTLDSIRIVNSLQGARVGVVGGLAMTFYNMEVSTNKLLSRLGVEVVNHDMHQLTERISAIDPQRVTSELEKMECAAAVEGVSTEQMDITARVALALRDLASDNNHRALAVSDWPALQENPGMHPGGAFSWLEEMDYLPCASEGDILGAVSQLVALSMTGKVGSLLDMTEPDFDSGRLLMWHGGGGPLAMAAPGSARWINHPMIGREDPKGPRFGCVADFVFAPGQHTIFRISDEAGALFQMTANVVDQDPSGFDGCRGWMEDFAIWGERSSLGDVVSTVMTQGLEHHFVAIPGNYRSVLSEYAAWSGMTPIKRRPMRDHLFIEDYAR
jgi:L-fucose isomerase-like protein